MNINISECWQNAEFVTIVMLVYVIVCNSLFLLSLLKKCTYTKMTTVIR